MTDRGVIYYATGTEYVEQALRSAESLKRHNDLSVTVYSDKEIDSPYVDSVVTISPSEYPLYDRINYFKQTPYDRTIQMDTDTYILGDLSPVFELLDRFNIAAAYDEYRDTATEQSRFENVDIDAPDSFPEFQCGVIAYRNNETVQSFFDDWQARYGPYRDRNLLDQPHFREALYNNEIAVGTLPSEYNVRINFGGFLYNDAKVIHYAGSENRPFVGTEVPDAEFSEGLADTLNHDTPRSRVVIVKPREGIRVLPTVDKSNSMRYRIRRSVNERGVVGTLRRAVEKLVCKRLS
jgi:hypothetical protein